MEFVVEYSLEKDIKVYLDALWQSKWVNYGKSYYEIGQKYLPVEFLDSLKDAPTKEDAQNIVLKYFENTRSQKFDQGSVLIAKWFSRFLNEEKESIIHRLEKLYDQKFPFPKITVYLNTFFTNPYNYDEKWYMVGRDYNFWGLLGTSTHELNHFMFYYYFRDKVATQGFERPAIEFLKEALAVLTSNNPATENQNKTSVLPIQNFVYENRDKPIDKIIELVIKNKLLDNIITTLYIDI